MSSAGVELTHIPEIRRATFDNLMQLYLHDMSNYVEMQVDADGLFPVSQNLQRYWREPGRYPFFIRVPQGVAGFALVREVEEGCHAIAEFFVIRRLRRHGIGKSAAFQLFDRFPGEWHVAEEEANVPAQKFWRTILAEYTGGEFEESTSQEGPTGPMQIFRSREISPE